MVGGNKRVRIILFKNRLYRGELTPPHIDFINWIGAQEVRTLPNVNGIICTLPEGITDEQIRSAGIVAAIEENFKIRLVPWAPAKFKPFMYDEEQLIPWGVHYIGAHVCWPETRGQGVKVAVIDSGIDGSHPNLGGNLKGGINLVVPGASYYDDNGHGTHVAGIIAAANIGRGIVGVAPEAELYAVKVLDQWGEGTILNAINALDWCLKNRIHVANMSFGTDKYSSALEEAVRAAHRRGLLIVAAAGNDGGPNTVDYPSVFDETISVAVVDSRGKLASFSSSGPEVDLLAPGSDIVSTYLWGSYVRLSGSSMATAHITGAAALLKAKYPEEDANQLRRRLLSGAQKAKGIDKNLTGAGIVRVDLSLKSFPGA
ncbi:S8 family peptidase [Desulforamulus putei]|uniref:Subtilase family protein n=1 Tax=Desulforamulus putei DSM 12395 TaxID=1121429 RepID=A0A1M4Z5P4_9FIRM|nr:S8 family peptidase [Desulforamulus putei]SHF12916.1 Subtilase family protein [Desulforamulus putei DSM 12395]